MRRPARWSEERGTGVISSVAGISVFLVFLLFAVQLTVNLYATSTVTAAGYDAARVVASRRVDHANPVSVRRAEADAERGLRQLLGEIGRTAQITWSVDAQVVRLRISTESPGILPPVFARGVGRSRIDRTFVVRIEQVGEQR